MDKNEEKLFIKSWQTRQKDLPTLKRMPLDMQLVCYNYASMMYRRGVSMSDVARFHGLSKEAVRQWFERGLPDEVLYKLDEAISQLAPLPSPDPAEVATWQGVMLDAWHARMQENTFVDDEVADATLTVEDAEAPRPEYAHGTKQRKLHCRRGHTRTPENTLWSANNRPVCQDCKREQAQKRRKK